MYVLLWGYHILFIVTVALCCENKIMLGTSRGKGAQGSPAHILGRPLIESTIFCNPSLLGGLYYPFSSMH